MEESLYFPNIINNDMIQMVFEGEYFPMTAETGVVQNTKRFRFVNWKK